MKLINYFFKWNDFQNKFNAILIVFACLFFASSSTSVKAQTCSQNYTNPWQWGPHSTWFFGEGVFMNFPNGTNAPVVTYKTVVGDKNRSYEGTATINDNAGNLICYSNGRGIWDASGTVISNGLLAGNEDGAVGARSSAVQGIVAVRHPFNPGKIFIITSDDALSTIANGVNYSVYDIQSNTMTTPVRLKDDLGNDYRTTEQVDATFHTNGFDVWIVVRQSGEGNPANFRNFYAYLLTCNGLNTTPVKSVAGPTVKGNWTNNWERGSLKFSWKGNKAVTVNHVNDWASYDEAIVVYDFNQSTGVLSNTKAVAGKWGGGTWSGPTYESMYDCEWAPDNKGVYMVPAGGTARLLWMNASYSTKDSIYNSIKVTTNQVNIPGDIKLGGDGKLYQATFQNNLNVFSFPTPTDLNEGTNITRTVMNLTQNSTLGLTNMFIPPIDYLDIQTPQAMTCDDAPADLQVNWFCRGTNAEDAVNNPNGWKASCGACMTDAGNGTFDPSIAGQGSHTIYYSYGSACTVEDSLVITVGPCNTCKDTSISSIPAQCTSNGVIHLKDYQGTAKAGVWSIVSMPTGGTANITNDSIFNVNNTVPGNYVVQYTVNNQLPSCGNNPQRTIVINGVSNFDISVAKKVCFEKNETTTASINATYNTYLWSTGSILSTTTVKQKGKLWLTVTDQNSCVGSDTLDVVEDCPIILCVPNVFTPNGDSENDELSVCKDVYKEIVDKNYIMEHIKEITFEVYDRWGIRMFQSKGVFPVWDGKYNNNDASAGVYYWVLRYTDTTNATYELTGFAQLIR